MTPESKYIKYLEGNFNLLLGAPHGGSLKPKDIPVRKTGVKVTDTYTRKLIEEIYKLANPEQKPHCLYTTIHRSRVDLNRNIKEGCEGNRKSQFIWNSWNNSIKNITSSVKKILFVDLHSHNDSNTFHLGYNLSSTNYLKLMKNKEVGAKSTLDCISLNKYDMLFGPYSIKTSLENAGYEVFIPNGKDVYFNGGYNIETHSGNCVGAIQIESSVFILKDKLENVAKTLYESFLLFMKEYEI